jgi:hypothetical protein
MAMPVFSRCDLPRGTEAAPAARSLAARAKRTRRSCRAFVANAVLLQLDALGYNLAKVAEPWSLTSLREKLIKIGAKVVSQGRYSTFQMAELAASRQMFKLS